MFLCINQKLVYAGTRIPVAVTVSKTWHYRMLRVCSVIFSSPVTIPNIYITLANLFIYLFVIYGCDIDVVAIMSSTYSLVEIHKQNSIEKSLKC